MEEKSIWETMSDDDKLKLVVWALDKIDEMFNEISSHVFNNFEKFDWSTFEMSVNKDIELLPTICQEFFNDLSFDVTG